MSGDRNLIPGETVQDGDYLTITLTAKGGWWSTPQGQPVIRLNSIINNRLRSGAVIKRPAPAIKFLPGDVVVVRFGAREFTYVRGLYDFPGDMSARKTDAEIAEKFASNEARLIARNGVAFPGAITRDNAHLLTTIPF